MEILSTYARFVTYLYLPTYRVLLPSSYLHIPTSYFPLTLLARRICMPHLKY